MWTYCRVFTRVVTVIKTLKVFPSPGSAYLRERGQEAFEVGGEFAEGASLPLGIHVRAHFDEHGQTRSEPAQVPFLELCLVPQLLTG